MNTQRSIWEKLNVEFSLNHERANFAFLIRCDTNSFLYTFFSSLFFSTTLQSASGWNWENTVRLAKKDGLFFGVGIKEGRDGCGGVNSDSDEREPEGFKR